MPESIRIRFFFGMLHEARRLPTASPTALVRKGARFALPVGLRYTCRMLAIVYSCAVVGMNGALVQVEVDTANGLPNFVVVGLPDAAVIESRERVQAAIRNVGFAFPQRRITVNLAPAAIRK